MQAKQFNFMPYGKQVHKQGTRDSTPIHGSLSFSQRVESP